MAVVATQKSEPAGGAGVGSDIRALRKASGLTLTELAVKVGRSVAFLSKIERDLSSPSIEDLKAIANAFGVPVGWFFSNDYADERERGIVVRAGFRRKLGTKEAGLVEELLSPELGGSFEILRSVFEPGASLEHDIIRNTEEAGILISGALTLWIDGEEFHLESGDSFRFKARPYRWRNSGDEPAIAIWVVNPPLY